MVSLLSKAYLTRGGLVSALEKHKQSSFVCFSPSSLQRFRRHSPDPSIQTISMIELWNRVKRYTSRSQCPARDASPATLTSCHDTSRSGFVGMSVYDLSAAHCNFSKRVYHKPCSGLCKETQANSSSCNLDIKLIITSPSEPALISDDQR